MLAFKRIRNAPLPWMDVDPVFADGEPEGMWPLIGDVLAVVNAFTGVRNAPLPWMDVDPVFADGEPEGMWALIGDVLAVVNAFSGQPYPGNGPLGCQ